MCRGEIDATSPWGFQLPFPGLSPCLGCVGRSQTAVGAARPLSAGERGTGWAVCSQVLPGGSACTVPPPRPLALYRREAAHVARKWRLWGARQALAKLVRETRPLSYQTPGLKAETERSASGSLAGHNSGGWVVARGAGGVAEAEARRERVRNQRSGACSHSRKDVAACRCLLGLALKTYGSFSFPLQTRS